MCDFNLESKGKSIKLSQIFVTYTLLFLLTFCVTYIEVFMKGNSFLLNNDNFQYVNSLYWYSEYVKKIFNNITHFNFTIPQWIYSNGEGTDISTLLWSIIGDPFAFIIALMPKKMLLFFINIMAIVRIYLSGVSFIILCYSKDKNSSMTKIIIPALTYAFSVYSLWSSVNFHWFLNALVFLPLIFLGIDIIMNGGKPYIYILSFSIQIITSLYFTYHISIFILIYVLFSIISKSIKWKYSLIDSIKQIVEFFLFSLISFLIGACTFLPSAYIMVNSSQSTRGNIINLFYKPSYYKHLFTSFFSASVTDFVIIGLASIAILTFILFCFIKKDKNIALKATITIFSIFTLLPIFGSAMSGFAHPTNRWIYILSFLICYVLYLMHDNLITCNRENFVILTYILLLYLVLSFIIGVKDNIFFMQICISIIIICFLNIYQYNVNIMSGILLITTILSISLYGNARFSLKVNTPNELLSYNNYISHIDKTDSSFVKKYREKNDDNAWSRFASNSIYNKKDNSAFFVTHENGVKNFTSLYEKVWNDYFKCFGMLNTRREMFGYYNERSSLLSLMSVKYYVAGDEKHIPYGFVLVEDKKTNGYINIYRNNYYLPLFYTYNETMNIDDFDKLNFVEKQELVCKYAVTDKPNNEDKRIGVEEITSFPIEFQIKDNKDVKFFKNSLEIKKDNSTIEFSFEGYPNSETYVLINNFRVDNSNIDSSRIVFESDSGSKSHFYYLSNKSIYYAGINSFCLNVGYNEKPIHNIKLSFEKKGVYTFDDFKIIVQPMDYYVDSISKLYDKEINNIDCLDDLMNVKVNFSNDKFLVSSMTYHIGWKAYIDGKETKIYKANIKHMGIDVPKGKHEIEFRFSNPYILYSRYISLLTITIFVIVLFIKKKVSQAHN